MYQGFCRLSLSARLDSLGVAIKNDLSMRILTFYLFLFSTSSLFKKKLARVSHLFIFMIIVFFSFVSKKLLKMKYG